ncbi:MAG: M17 family peptidase N-terminal domain-containing protein, partial [Neofamilia sp.]
MIKFHFKESDELIIEFAFENKEEKNFVFFEGKLGEVYPLENDKKILLGLGKKEEFDLEKLTNAVYKLGRFLKDKEVDAINFSSKSFEDLDNADYILAIVEGLILSTYTFDFYKNEKDKYNLKDVYFDLDYSKVDSKIDDLVNELEKVLESQFFSRDIINMRSNT